MACFSVHHLFIPSSASQQSMVWVGRATETVKQDALYAQTSYVHATTSVFPYLRRASCLFAKYLRAQCGNFPSLPNLLPSCRLSSLRLCPALLMGKRQKVNKYLRLISENYFPGCFGKDLWIIKLCKCSLTDHHKSPVIGRCLSGCGAC